MDFPVEPQVALGTGLAVLGSKEILNKLLGPTADYIGSKARGLVEKCDINLDRIFLIASKRLGAGIEGPGTVNARVLKEVWSEGRFCEDELMAEYYGGILASSRTSDGRDDRGVALLATVKQLSVYQLRFHYLVYRGVQQIFFDQPFNLGLGTDHTKMRIFVPATAFAAFVGLPTDSADDVLGHCLCGLNRHGLTGTYKAGSQEFLGKDDWNETLASESGKGGTNRFNPLLKEFGRKETKFPSEGLVVSPSLPGAELFVWVQGGGDTSGRSLLKMKQKCGSPEIDLPTGLVAVSSLPTKDP